MKKMTVNKTTLNNGLRILTKKIPHVRSVSMGVWVNAGARDETREENGLSHFIEHMIFKGTKKRNAYQIAKEFDAIGGVTNAFTSKENTCYYARVMDTHLATMVDIMSDIFLNSVFHESEVEKERPVIYQEVGMVEDSPEDYIHMMSESAFWGDNALGWSILGPRENILRFDAETIKSFFHKFYQPDRIVISVAGNVEHAQFTDLIGPAFEAIPIGKDFPERIMPHGSSELVMTHRDLEQVHVCLETLGLAITDPRRYAFSLMNTILGGNMSSRLFQEIRERKGLAYSVYTFITPFVDTGAFGAYAGVEPDKALETVKLILKEMRRIKETQITQNELREAKEYTKGSFLLASESTDNQMVRLAQNEIHYGRDFSMQSVVDKIDAISADEIMALSKELFRSDRLTLSLLGPLKDRKPFEDVLFF